jgi:hypothetical protein
VIHPYDLDSLHAMLGPGEIPVDVDAEYAIRLNLLHRGGQQGPLGPLGLVELVRSLGYGKSQAAVEESKTVWRDYPQDGSVRVEVLEEDGLSVTSGTFTGFVGYGTLAIQVSDDPVIVREYLPNRVRIVSVDPKWPTKELVPQPPETVKPVDPVAVIEAIEAVEPALEQEARPHVVVTRKDWKAATDWSAIAAGLQVLVEHEDEIWNGTLVSVVDPQTLSVQLEGEADPRVIDVEHVELK